MVSNEFGINQVTGLLPGDYELEVTVSGFATLKQALRLEVGQQLTLDFNLKLASVTTTIEIGAVDVLRTNDSSVNGILPTRVRPGLITTSPVETVSQAGTH